MKSMLGPRLFVFLIALLTMSLHGGVAKKSTELQQLCLCITTTSQHTIGDIRDVSNFLKVPSLVYETYHCEFVGF